MQWKKLLLIGSVVILCSSLFGNAVYAQEEKLPKPSITPDSPFYFVDILGEKISLLLTFNDQTKVKKTLQYAEERLAEAYAMSTKNKPKEVIQAINDYKEYLNKGVLGIKQAPAKMDIVDIAAIAKNLSTLDKVEEVAPEKAKTAISQAKETSLLGHKEALKALTKVNPEKATEINLKAIESRLKKVTEIITSYEPTHDVKEDVKAITLQVALRHFEELNKFGEEICQIARKLGKDTTPVEKLVAQSTAIHLAVLTDVYEKLPEPAKTKIEKPIEVAIVSHTQAVEALKQKGAITEIPKISETKIPEKVKRVTLDEPKK